EAAPRAEIVNDGAGRFLARQIIDRGDMTDGEIDDMDIVPDAGAVARRVVVPEHFQFRQAADGDLRDEREKIVRNAVRVFADPARRMRADRIEIAKIANLPARIGAREVFQYFLDEKLRAPV